MTLELIRSGDGTYHVVDVDDPSTEIVYISGGVSVCGEDLRTGQWVGGIPVSGARTPAAS